MRLSRSTFIRAMLVAVLLSVLMPVSAPAQDVPRRVIVLFDEGAAPVALGKAAALGAHPDARLPLIRGAAMTLPPGLSIDRLRAVPGIAHVEYDLTASVLKAPAPVQPAQTTPWGVDRVGADSAWASTTGDTVKVAVVDTGISTSHPDLVANLAGGFNAINPSKSHNDDNGHGSHVAGIIGASVNTIGVVGAAPDVDLYAIKVLGRSGSGWVSDIIEGIQWAVDHDIDVINMSLGASGYSSAFDLACQQALDAGVTIVAAAGNSGPDMGTVEYPAAFDGVLGVSATDSSDAIAWFSSRGEGVDLAAPGVGILSTYKGSAYATMSGTSMASPHVAGVVALVLTTPVGSDDTDADGTWDPAEVGTRLARTAEDLGSPGADPLFGSGLVRADLAVSAK